MTAGKDCQRLESWLLAMVDETIWVNEGVRMAENVRVNASARVNDWFERGIWVPLL